MRADPSAAPDSLFFDETGAQTPANRFTPISAAERLYRTGSTSSYRDAYLEHLRSVAPDVGGEPGSFGGSEQCAPVGWPPPVVANAPADDFFPWQEERVGGTPDALCPPQPEPPEPYIAPGAYSAPYQPYQPYIPYADAYPSQTNGEAEPWEPIALPEFAPMPLVSTPEPPAQRPAKPEAPAPSVPERPRVEQKKTAPPEPSSRRAHQARGLSDMSPVRAVFMLALVFATLFACFKLGETALMALGGVEATRALQEEYRNAFGGELAADARRVELLPPGVTYAPTATPVATSAFVTAPPLISIQEPVVASMSRPTPDAQQQADARSADAGLAPTPTLVVRAKLRDYPENPMRNVAEAFLALVSENADIVGRFCLDGLIDQLVCQRDNTFYLTHNATGAFSATGALWLDESVSLRRPPENLLLRGKAASPNDLLTPMLSFDTGGAAFLAQNGLMRMDTIYEEASYVVFAVLRTDADPGSSGYFNYAGHPTFESDAQFSAYVAAARERSLYDVNVDVQPSDRLLTISALGDGRDTRTLVILARMVRPGESVSSLQAGLAAATVR